MAPSFLLVVGCAAAPAAPPRAADYGRPFEVVLTEYSFPILLGRASPGSVGGWDEHVSLRDWVSGWTRRPEPHDVDNAFVNYVLHPLSGSETHLLARRNGWTFGEAILFDAFSSFAWEVGYENVFERPSRVDLLVTAPAGALLGELRWAAARQGIAPWLLDPFGGHGEPFLELSEEGHLVVGIERRF